MIKKHAYYIL